MVGVPRLGREEVLGRQGQLYSTIFQMYAKVHRRREQSLSSMQERAMGGLLPLWTRRSH